MLVMLYNGDVLADGPSTELELLGKPISRIHDLNGYNEFYFDLEKLFNRTDSRLFIYKNSHVLLEIQNWVLKKYQVIFQVLVTRT